MGVVVPVLAPEPLVSPVIDSHCHLNVRDGSLHGDSRPDPDEMLKLAASVGVTKVVQIGCDVEAARWSVEIAASHPDVIAGVALHPNEAPRIFADQGQAGLENAYAAIAELAAHDVVRAVGETGLDYYRTEGQLRSVQQESFRWHIDLAKRLNKVLVIHDRDAHDDVIAVLESAGAPEKVLFHCFSGDSKMASYCAERGWYMSFAGVITFKNADDLREALRVVPDDLVLVETDSPYLTPMPYRGKPNGSFLMPLTVRRMAEVRGVDEATMAKQLWDNTHRVFGDW